MQSSAFDLLEQLSDDEGELLVAKTAALAAKATAAKASSKPLPKPAKAKPVMSKAPAPPPTQPAKYAPGVTPPPPGWTPRKMCKYYEQHGACGLGKLCWYAHHRSELTKEKPKAVVPAKVQMPTSTMNNVPGFLYKTQMCAYHPLGRCLKGNDCSYAHSQAELRKHQGHGRESKLSAAPPAPVPQSRPSAETYAQQFPAAFGFVASSSSSMEAAQKPIASLPRPQPSTQVQPQASEPLSRPKPRHQLQEQLQRHAAQQHASSSAGLHPVAATSSRPQPAQSSSTAAPASTRPQPVGYNPSTSGRPQPYRPMGSGPSATSRPQPYQPMGSVPSTAGRPQPAPPTPVSSVSSTSGRPQPSAAGMSGAAQRMQALSLEPSEAVREEIDLPDMLVCPITQEVFKDPVVAADGFTYERAAITDWLRKSLTSPMTNEALPHDKVVPNFSIRQTISSCLGR